MNRPSERSLLLLLAAVQFTHIMDFMIMTAGLASSVGGWVVTKGPSGELVNYHWLGWLAVAAALTSLWLARRVRVNEATAPSPKRESDRTVGSSTVIHL